MRTNHPPKIGKIILPIMPKNIVTLGFGIKTDKHRTKAICNVSRLIVWVNIKILIFLVIMLMIRNDVNKPKYPDTEEFPVKNRRPRRFSY